MVICSLDSLKNPWKKKESGIEQKIVVVLQQGTEKRQGSKRSERWNSCLEFLSLTLTLLARLTLTLTSAFKRSILRRELT